MTPRVIRPCHMRPSFFPSNSHPHGLLPHHVKILKPKHHYHQRANNNNKLSTIAMQLFTAAVFLSMLSGALADSVGPH